MRLRTAWMVLLAGVGLALGGRAPLRAQDQPVEPALTPRGMMADQFVLMAKQALGGPEAPRPDELTRARILLEFALELDPASAELWRLRWELARQTKDEPAQLQALTKYANLRPDDDTAQLALILRLVSKEQTLEQRLAAVQRLLDSPSANRLSAPLRSRLALYVAQGASELGNTDLFTARLKQATTLDPANHQAMRLVQQMTVARGGTPLEIATAALASMRTGPADVEVRRFLADLLLSQALYRLAAQQYQVAQAFSSQPPDESFYANWVVSLGAAGQPEDALTLLAQVESMLEPKPAKADASPTTAPAKPAPAKAAPGPTTRPKAAAGSTTRPAAKPPANDLGFGEPPTPAADVGVALPPPAATQPATLVLPPGLELVRLAILQQSDLTTRAARSYDLLHTALQARAQTDPAVLGDLLWLEVLFGPAAPDSKGLDQLVAQRGEKDALAQRLLGWAALRRGDNAKAGQILEPLAKADPAALYGMVRMARAAHVPKDEQATLLRRVVVTAPGSLVGLLAARDLAGLGIGAPSGTDGPAITRLVAQVPSAILTPGADENPWLGLDVEPAYPEAPYLAPVTLRLTLRNRTDLPLSLGAGEAIPTRLFIMTNARAIGLKIGELPPVVVDMDRRLRLEPKQALTVEARLDWGELGISLTNYPMATFLLNAKAVLDPRPQPGGEIAPAPGGVAAWAYRFGRKAQAVRAANMDQWLAAFDSTNAAEQYGAIATLGVLAQTFGESEEAVVAQKRVAEALTARYGKFAGNPLAQAWIVRFAGTPPDGATLFQAVQDLAQRSDNAMVRIAQLATHVRDAQSPTLLAALRDSDAKVVEFAKALRTSLELKPPPATPAAGETPTTNPSTGVRRMDPGR